MRGARGDGRAHRANADGTVDYRVDSPGSDGLRQPSTILDCGNSGTSLRLFSGIVAGLPMTVVLDGDESLRRRPVARIIEPLRSMGAALRGRDDDSRPTRHRGRPHPAAGHRSRHARCRRAQVKSAILLAGLRADGTDDGHGGGRDARPHGADAPRTRRRRVERSRRDDGSMRDRTAREEPTCTQSMSGSRGDVSAAAFWLVAGAIHPDADLSIRTSA